MVRGAELGCSMEHVDRHFRYLLPEGCTVRNTFLELLEEGESAECVLAKGKAARSKHPRSRSCPEKAVSSEIRRSDASQAIAECNACEDDAVDVENRPSCLMGDTKPELFTEFKHEESDQGSSRSTDAGESTVISGQSLGEHTFGYIEQMDAGSYMHAPSMMEGFCMSDAQEAMWYGQWSAMPSPMAAGAQFGFDASQAFTASMAPAPPPMPVASSVNSSPKGSGSSGGAPGTGDSPKSSRKAASDEASLVLRGLPYNVTEDDIAAFIEMSGVPREALASGRSINLLTNPHGRPSGLAEIMLSRQMSFWEVQQKLHLQFLGARYIEALPPRNGKLAMGAASPAGRHGGAKRDSWRR